MFAGVGWLLYRWHLLHINPWRPEQPATAGAHSVALTTRGQAREYAGILHGNTYTPIPWTPHTGTAAW